MIARVWSAQTTPDRAPVYVEHLRTKVLPTLRTVDGYGGALLLERPAAGAVEIVVITFWQSLEAIQRFAGTDLERAVVADEAEVLLTQFDGRVKHYEVAVKDEAVVGCKLGNKLIVEGEEFHGHQDDPSEPLGKGPQEDTR
jgi:heme-degrading monooxygenase HmoA